jgi:hypothetical protein
MRIRKLLGLQSRPSKALIAWMQNPGELGRATTLNLSAVRTATARPNNMSTQEWEEAEFFNRLGDSIRGTGAPFAANIDVGVEGDRKIAGSDAPSDGYIQAIAILVQTTLTLSNLSIKTLRVQQNSVRIRANNCTIRELIVNAQGINADIRLHQCNVGTLHVVPGAIGHYEMQGGCLLNVACPPPGAGNPFTGTVSFTPDVFFPRERDTYILLGPQPYRNMRYHLRSLENAQMANLIHSAELAVEREDDSWTNRFVSYLYEWMSDFGSSALRPSLWLVVLYLSSVCVIYHTDGAVPAPELVGWQLALVDPLCGDLTRALYLALQPVVNPIGIFGPKSLLIPRYSSLAVWLSLHGFFGLILLALLIFAIRRRFKIQA